MTSGQGVGFLRGGYDTESLLKSPGRGVLCVVCFTQPRYALTEAISRRGASITAEIRYWGLSSGPEVAVAAFDKL